MRDAIVKAKRIVIKVGSSTLTHENGRLNIHRIEGIVKNLADLANMGKEVIFVSSGAVAAGLAPLGFKVKPSDLSLKQAAASVGQGVLLHMYEKIFREYGQVVGQILLTREDTVKKNHYVNVRRTLFALLNLGVIPIINENDVVAIDEFKIGDNDTLSANVASLIEADLLILLSDIDGLYTDNPQTNPKATLISTVDEITPQLYDIAGGAGSSRGTGGMYTKIVAANIAVNSGVSMVITNGESPDNIRKVALGEDIGTYFVAKESRPHIRKRWLAFGTRLQGAIYVDSGCAEAILKKGSSLLPVGIVSVSGQFKDGDTVSIFYKDKEIGRGLVHYSSEEIEEIKGLKTEKLAEALCVKTTYDEVIHRDNMIILS